MQPYGTNEFKIKDHIAYREHRYQKATISNKDLLGLTTVEINPTELCNRKCSFCPRVDPSIYPNRNLHMSVQTAKLLVEQLNEANFDGDINITGFGEPTLNPDILEIIKICALNFHTEIITNGDTIRKGKLSVDDLKNAGLNLLIVDCYDGNEQIKWFEDLLGDSELPYLIRNHYDDGSDNLIEQYGYNNRGGSLYKAETIAQQCFLPFYKSFIDWNGDVRLCCNDWFRLQKSFGNIHQTHYKDIWMSKEFAYVRRHLKTGNRQCLSACKNCDTNGTYYGSPSVDEWTKKIDK